MTRTMRNLIGVALTAGVLSLSVEAAAQTTQATKAIPGTPKITNAVLKGEVVYLEGDYLVAKMIPAGEYRFFHLKPGKTATIDGVVMPLNKVPLGTVLTATVTTTETPIVDRTVTTLKGTVWNVPNPKQVILTLANGENKMYDVPPGIKFDVDGTVKEAMELRPGMKITATKVIESPRTEISESNVVTGVKPKSK